MKESACKIIGKVDKSKLDLNGKLVHGVLLLQNYKIEENIT